MSRQQQLRRLFAGAPRFLRTLAAPVAGRLLGLETHGVNNVRDNVRGMPVSYDLDSVIGRALCVDAGFEETEIDFFAKRLSSDTDPVVLDIGANIGWHTLRWAQAVPGLRVHAFEPSPRSRALLEWNVNAGDLNSRVTVEPAAVSNRSGSATFYECKDGAFSSLKDTRRSGIESAYTVAVTTIDEFQAEKRFSRISLIKIDVEGFEHEVIVGAINTLRSLRPDLFVEIYQGEESNVNPKATIELLRGLGYRASVFVNGALETYSDHNDHFYNYFFTCPESDK